MRKINLILFSLFCFCFFLKTLNAQNESSQSDRKKKIDLSNRANDHLMLQFGMAGWNGIPDTISKKGFSRTLNVYFLFDFPFKSNPKLSMAFGPGIGSDHILFSKTLIGIKSRTAPISFRRQYDSLDHYKKTKLATVYLEAPVEFRYSSRPQDGKGIKLALGVKIGTMIDAHTRSARFENRSNTFNDGHVLKESSRSFFNRNRISLTARAGYSHFTVFGSYQVTTLFKDGAGPVIRPFSVGITLSGL
ncbi:MAG: PorT family protein [Chitinophagaceae bacterium]|nr:PorT family protein [Chitinophagaceae bacterium]